MKLNKKMESEKPEIDFFDDIYDDKETAKDTKENINNNIINNEKLDVKELLDFQNPSKEKENIEEVSLENIDEDLYVQELYLRLNQMKQERKIAEDNAKLLDN